MPPDAAVVEAPAAAAPAAGTLLSDTPNTKPAADTSSPAAGAPAAETGAAEPEAKDGATPATAEDKPAERVAPEKYEFKPAEGHELDADLLGEFEGVARELNMPQAEAQALVDRLAPKITARFANQQAQAVEAASTEWATATKSDKEIGGDALTENLSLARKALETFGSPELRTLLEDSRLGNHPEVVRFMARAGRAISADSKLVTGSAPANGAGAQSIYAASKMNP